MGEELNKEFQLVEESLDILNGGLRTVRNVASVGLYLVTYVINRTDSERVVVNDPLYQLLRRALENVAFPEGSSLGIVDASKCPTEGTT